MFQLDSSHTQGIDDLHYGFGGADDDEEEVEMEDEMEVNVEAEVKGLMIPWKHKHH
jgi:hypothetical protein